MRKTDIEKEMLTEFAEFANAAPAKPSKDVDRAVMDMVANDLLPSPMKVYGKFTLVEAASGLLTLAFCPQFGFGFGQHNEFLHSLHATTTPVVFYLLCGLFFVLLGAGMSGLILNRDEVRSVGNKKFLYFVIYSVLAYLILIMLGTEAFVISSLVWILGAFLGNVLGFEAVIRLRHAKI
jgi:hypothetical protein